MSNEILLIDDDADIRETLGELLENKGYGVTGASNGREALTFLRSGGNPCVILLDLMMPVMDGYQFRSEQVRDATLASIPTVVITAGASVRKEELAGASIVPKPLELDKLMSAIEQHCSSPKGH